MDRGEAQPQQIRLQHDSFTSGLGNIEKAGAERLQEPEDWKVRCDIVSPRNDNKAEPMVLQQYGCLDKH